MALVAPELVVELVLTGTRDSDGFDEIDAGLFKEYLFRFWCAAGDAGGLDRTGAMRSMSMLGCEDVVALVWADT
jgi:hypothetical protein